MNTELAKKLYIIIKPFLGPDEENEEGEERSSFSISKALDKQLKVLDRLQAVANASDDVGELKSVISASTNIINQMSKLKDDVDAERALKIVEDAVIEALDELGSEEIRNRFRKLVEQKTKHAREVRRA